MEAALPGNKVKTREVAGVTAVTRTLDMAAACCLPVVMAAGIGAFLMMRSATWSLQPGEMDLAKALPNEYWIYLIVGTLAGVVGLARAKSDAAITGHVASIAFLYGPSFLLGLYPAIAGWDTYLHASPAASLLAGQGIAANNLYATQYPGSTSLLAVLSGVTGLTPVDSALVVTVGAEMSLTLIWLGISQLFMGRKAAGWAALALLALTPAIITNDHFSPFFTSYLSVGGILLLLCLALHECAGRWWGISICLLLLVAFIIISHPFMPIVALFLVGGVAVWGWRKKSPNSASINWFALAVCVALLSWMFYVATTYFGTGVSFLKDILLGTQDAVDDWTGLSVMEGLRRASTDGRIIIALRWAAYAGVGLVAASGLLLPRERPRVIVPLGLAVAGLLSGTVGFASAAPWIQRVLYLVPPMLVIAAGISVVGWTRRFHWGLGVKTAGASIMGAALILGLFVWHPPTLVSSVHPEEAAFAVWPQETAGAAYMARLQNGAPTTSPVVVGSGLQTMIVYSYFKPDNAAFTNGLSMGSDLQGTLAQNPLLFNGNYIIRSQRQNITSYQAQDVGSELWTLLDSTLNARADRVYDNGFVQVFHKK